MIGGGSTGELRQVCLDCTGVHGGSDGAGRGSGLLDRGRVEQQGDACSLCDLVTGLRPCLQGDGLRDGLAVSPDWFGGWGPRWAGHQLGEWPAAGDELGEEIGGSRGVE